MMPISPPEMTRVAWINAAPKIQQCGERVGYLSGWRLETPFCCEIMTSISDIFRHLNIIIHVSYNSSVALPLQRGVGGLYDIYIYVCMYLYTYIISGLSSELWTRGPQSTSDCHSWLRHVHHVHGKRLLHSALRTTGSSVRLTSCPLASLVDPTRAAHHPT